MRRRVLFRRDVPLPAPEFLRGPAGQLHSANLFASCPAARLPNTFETGGAHGIFALRSFHPVRRSLGFGDPRRAKSCVAFGVSNLADPPAVFVMPSSIYFFRGIGRSNFLTHIRHKKRTIAGSHFGFWVFPRDKPHPFPLLCGHGPILPWAFSPSRFSDVTRRARTGSTPYAPSVPGHRFRRHAALGLFVDVRKSVRLGVISPTTSLPSAALQRIKKPMPSDRRLRVPPFAPCMRFCTVHVHSRRMTIGLFSHPMPNCRRFP